MANVIIDGVAGDTGTHTATGETEVIASGVFHNNRVQVWVNQSTLALAPVHTFEAPGAVKLATAATTVITLTVVGLDADSAIDVSAT
jgi:hypothetical protein